MSASNHDTYRRKYKHLFLHISINWHRFRDSLGFASADTHNGGHNDDDGH